MRGYWNGDEWRWRLTAPSWPSISVIEPPSGDGDKDKKEDDETPTVPFGFSRALSESRGTNQRSRGGKRR